MDLQTGKGDDVVDPDLEMLMREHYQNQYRRYGDAPTARDLLARLTPALQAASPRSHQHDRSRWSIPRILPRRALAPRFGQRGTPRMALLGALVAVAVLTGAAAFAVAPWLTSVFTADPGAFVAHQQPLGQDVHLVQTVDGETVTVDWVYADANRILIRYKVEPTSGDHTASCEVLTGNVMLTDAAGRRNNGLPDIRQVIPSLPSRPESAACLDSFDAAPVVGTPSVLRLRLEIDPLCPGSPSNVETPQASPALASEAHQKAQQATAPCLTAPAGPPATFDLTVPYYGGHVVMPNQQAAVDRNTVTLERMVVAPSETRLYFSHLDASWQSWVHITVNGNPPALPDQTLLFPLPPRQVDGDTVFDVFASLSGAHGHWVVSLEATPPPPAQSGQGAPLVVTVWTFPFDL